MLQPIDTGLSVELKIKILNCIPTFEQLPGVVIVHDLAAGRVVYISPKGLELLNTTLEEIASMTHEEYHRKHFNDEDAKDYVPKLFGLIAGNNDNEMVTFFQQVRFAGSSDWTWHLSSLKIFHRDQEGKPLLAIGLALPVDAMHHITAKAERLLNENNFMRKNLKNFSQLTRREKEVLRITALGKTAREIADELFIAETTVETHRRNLKNKLQVNTYFELSQYAMAFDLI
jgi:DNA-binding CsgD family transcriptional regulator